MNRQLMDYIRAESQCNYLDIIDYFTEINNLGSDELKAKVLGNLVWFIAMNENLNSEQFKNLFGDV